MQNEKYGLCKKRQNRMNAVPPSSIYLDNILIAFENEAKQSVILLFCSSMASTNFC